MQLQCTYANQRLDSECVQILTFGYMLLSAGSLVEAWKSTNAGRELPSEWPDDVHFTDELVFNPELFPLIQAGFALCIRN